MILVSHVISKWGSISRLRILFKDKNDLISQDLNILTKKNIENTSSMTDPFVGNNKEIKIRE
jgi:hypothetical protein